MSVEKFELFFQNTEELKEFSPIPVSLEFNLLKPVIRSVQEEFIKPIVSEGEMDVLLLAMRGDKLSDEQRMLVDKIKSPLAQLTVLQGIPLMNVKFQSGGLSVTQSENSAPAAKWRVDEAKEQLGYMGQKGLDDLITFMEENADTFTTYAVSDERLVLFSNYVNTSEDFNAYSMIPVGKFMLNQLRPLMARLESEFIDDLISSDVADDMLTNIMNRTSLGVYAPLLPYIQRVIVHLTMANAVEEMSVKIDERGLFMTFADSHSDSRTGFNRLPESMMDRVRVKNERVGNEWLARLKKHLEENASSYPLYEASSSYENDVTEINRTTPVSGSGIFPGL